MSARAPRLWPWILIPFVAIVAVVAIAIMGWLTYGAAGPWPWWGFFPWFPFVGFWIFFGFLFFFGMSRWSAGPWGGRGEGYRGQVDQSRAILRERYARGEITREEFDRMRRDLDEHLVENAYESDSAGGPGP